MLNNRLANDSFWALVGNVSSRGLGLLAAIVVARFLGKEIYGEYGMIRNTLISIAIFSTFGLGYTATKFVAEYKNTNAEKLKMFCKYANWITLAVSGLMAVLLFCFSGFVSNTILEAPHLDVPLKFVAAWIVFNALTTTQIGVLSGLGEFKKMARINTIVGLVTFCLSVVLTYFMDLNGALLALLLSQLLNWYLNHILVKKYIPDDLARVEDKKTIKEILIFSLPIALQEALYSATSWGSYFILIKLTDYGQLGLYSAAMQWSAVILFIPGILRNVILSHMSEVSEDTTKHHSILKQMLWINSICTVVPFLVILLFSNLIESFYGKTFDGLKHVLNITVFTTIFVSLSNVYVQAYMSKNKNWLMFVIRMLRDSGILLITYLLLQERGKNEGAGVLAVSTLLMSVVFCIVIALYYNLKIKNIES